MRRLLIVVLTLAIGGCGARPGPEALQATGRTVPDARLVPVLVATDRSVPGSHGEAHGSSRGALRYEKLVVSIPPGHQAGSVEWSKNREHDPSHSFVVAHRSILNEDEFVGEAAMGVRRGGQLGVFVHGYNETLAEAAFRLAQITVDLDSEEAVVPILFSWPSEGAVMGYVADRDGVTYARDDLVHVLRLLADLRTGGQISLFGHSLGGWLVMEALRQLRLQGRHGVLARYQVDLAAPDIDVDVFRKQLAVVGRLDPPITLFVAPDDRALAVSTHAARGHPRIGAVNVNDPALQEAAQNLGLRVIDISSVEPVGRTRHSRFVRLAAVASRVPALTSPGAVESARQGAFVLQNAAAALSLQAISSTTDPAVR
ncbi:alpha/beta hydrolase [Aurantimonas sp. HBX-1]|uniref:alpha/beta hydrolase n=1 Tax=Aurantimonas sp. HBX-1 TaxID=2906072 RepID=UPI001F2C8D04|nr:alpha/beta fold hydrolase [Aurantimonas sp. HBX-1]UIJ72594.1 alpha/beta fold hydrolase [Aurantimonas sp. HBX-1]